MSDPLVRTHVGKSRFGVTRAVTGAFALAGVLAFAGSTVAYAGPLGSVDSGSVAIGADPAQPLSPTPRLAVVDNFRDVAGEGAGYQGFGGVHLNRGVFYRSNALLPDDADLAMLDGLGITAVYDLRTQSEIVGKEDRLPAGATYTWLPALAGNLTGVTSTLKTPAEGAEFMREMNRTYVTDAAVRANFGKLFTALATTPGAQLVHCTAGKDRTGWSSAILQSLVGVPRETILADYLLTNEYSAASIQHSLEGLAALRGEAAAAVYDPILHVDASYLGAGFAQLEADYGNVYNYLLTGLNLSPQTIAALVNRLVG